MVAQEIARPPCIYLMNAEADKIEHLVFKFKRIESWGGVRLSLLTLSCTLWFDCAVLSDNVNNKSLTPLAPQM